MRRVGKWTVRVALLAAGGSLMQYGCMRTLANELDFLLVPEANGAFFYQSQLFDIFGPGILRLFN